MKRLLDRGANSNEGTPKDKLFTGDSMKLYNFFLNKLLTMSSDPFFNKKHQAYLLHTNMISNAPNFYERMNHDINNRRKKDDVPAESSEVSNTSRVIIKPKIVPL